MNSETQRSIRTFFLELLVYALLVAGYYFLVLHLLGDWLARIYHNHRNAYAAVALFLILGQGVFLETATRVILGWSKRDRTEE